MRNKFGLLNGGPTKKGLQESLAFLSLQERRSDVLKFCLDNRSFPYEHYFICEAENVDKTRDPKTFAVLEQSDFRQFPPKESQTTRVGNDPAGVFDKDGKLPVDW